MSLGKNILTIRESRGISIEDLARKCNVTCNKVIDWEAGDTEPTITEIKIVSYVLDVTIDELVKGKNVVPTDERHYLTSKEYKGIAGIISSMRRNDNLPPIRKMGNILGLEFLYSIIKNAFISDDGAVYERFLIKNTDRETRVKYINRFFNEYDEAGDDFADYVEGNCEIGEEFTKLSKKLKEEFDDAVKRDNYILESHEGKSLFELNFIYDLEKLEDYSEKRINELYIDIQEYIKERTGETLLDRSFIFWANEAQDALESRNMDDIRKLVNAWGVIRDTYFLLVSEGKNA